MTGGPTNETARMISFHEGDPINESAVTTVLRQIADNNRAGGWRELKLPRP